MEVEERLFSPLFPWELDSPALLLSWETTSLPPHLLPACGHYFESFYSWILAWHHLVIF